MNVPSRLLLGPGPSPVAPRIIEAMTAPVLSHLDPALMAIMDDVRRRLVWAFGAAEGSFAFAVSGTGTSGMEAAVANVTVSGTRALVVVTGYFGDRLAQMFTRYGADVARVEVEWGHACEPDLVDRALRARGADVIAVVHAETSTGVVNPVEAIGAIAREHGAMMVVDAVTSLGALPIDVRAWGVDVCYGCTQKGLGAPSGLAPIVFSPRALERRSPARSFYLDVSLLEDYWVRRRYHHTISAPLVYALHEALVAVEEEGLAARADRHRRNHLRLVERLEAIGLGLLPSPADRLWTLNAVKVPGGVDEAAVRRRLLEVDGIEVGAGLGPLAGRIWRIGLMGSGSTEENVERVTGALASALARKGDSQTYSR